MTPDFEGKVYFPCQLTLNVSNMKLNTHKHLSAIIVVVGVVLMAGKIYADSEPGGIPSLLILTGLAWFFISRTHRSIGSV